MEPPLAAVGSTTVAVLSQSSGVAARRGHVVYNNCALYMLLYKQQCLGFCYCSRGVARNIVGGFLSRAKTQRAKHWPVEGFGGMPPQENFGK